MQLEGLWGLATIVGPIVLFILFIYVIMRNRSSKVPMDVTEEGTRANYAEEDRLHKAGIRTDDVQDAEDARKDGTL